MSNTEKIKFSIITVCYNAEKYMEDTIKSVLNQNYHNYEYIIKDGGSKDGTLDIVYTLLDNRENVTIVTSQDEGIYDAMNQAVGMAKGEYIFFLNAGDCFGENDVLLKTKQFVDKQDADVVYGNIISVTDNKKKIRKYYTINGKKIYFLMGACICHQAMFAKKKLFEEKKFDTDYIVCADREWQLFYLSKKKKFIPMHFEVATVLEDGFSKNNIDALESETKKCLLQYYKNDVWVYNLILHLKKSKILLIMIRVLERILFVKKHDGI